MFKRYGRGFTKDFGFAVVNGIAKPGAYIVKYDAYSLDQIKLVKVGNKPITAFAISQDGAILAFASADLSITLLDALSFRVSCIIYQEIISFYKLNIKIIDSYQGQRCPRILNYMYRC